MNRSLIRFAKNVYLKSGISYTCARSMISDSAHGDDLSIDDIDRLVDYDVIEPLNDYYPKLHVGKPYGPNRVEGHNVVVIQPETRDLYNLKTTAELQLEECVSLGNTLPNWQVIGKKIFKSHQIHNKHVFGPKKFEEIKSYIHSHKGVTAAFFGLELLSGIQMLAMERELGVPVYDRFTVVLNIFRQHARTREAKIQLALAELPYVRNLMRQVYNSSEHIDAHHSVAMLIGGKSEKSYDARVQIIKQRERKLRAALDKLRKHRESISEQRQRTRIPTVSIVGYTNSGKTSLIRYLTSDDRLEPKDQLFATLDVSAHLGQLDHHQKVYYLDTVGFISRIPTLLVEAFSETLKEVQKSDLIVHILDLTHPDNLLQYKTVTSALEQLSIPKRLLSNRLVVGNKSDLVKSDAKQQTIMTDMQISLKNFTNLQKLVDEIDKRLIATRDLTEHRIRVQNGGKDYNWLRKNVTVISCEPDEEDANYLICNALFDSPSRGRWSKMFGVKNVMSNIEPFNMKASIYGEDDEGNAINPAR